MNKKNDEFLSMLPGKLVASLLGNLLASKGVKRASPGKIKAGKEC